MNLMPLTRKGGCKVTNFSRDQHTSPEQFIKILSFINNNHWVLGDRCWVLVVCKFPHRPAGIFHF